MSWPTPEEEADLLRRLIARDPGGPADLATMCFEPLLGLLQLRYPSIDTRETPSRAS